MIVAWTGWVLLGFALYYNAECVVGSIGKGFSALAREFVRILGS